MNARRGLRDPVTIAVVVGVTVCLGVLVHPLLAAIIVVAHAVAWVGAWAFVRAGDVGSRSEGWSGAWGRFFGVVGIVGVPVLVSLAGLPSTTQSWGELVVLTGVAGATLAVVGAGLGALTGSLVDAILPRRS